VVEAPAVVVTGLVARAAMPDGVVGVVRGAFHREANRHRLLVRRAAALALAKQSNLGQNFSLERFCLKSLDVKQQ